MTRSILILLFTVITLTSVFAAGSTIRINRLNANGEREGWWVVAANNDPIAVNESTIKYKEGKYHNGRRVGVWITYHEDGVTPRLIGEYADNRPAGTYFKFDKKGKLIQASSVPRRIPATQSIESSNPLYSCKMMFSQREIIAGQVFFTNRLFKKDLAVQFWMSASMEQTQTESKLVDYSWLNANYTNILTAYTAIRTPKTLRTESMLAEIDKKPVTQNAPSPNRGLAYFHPPVLRSPRVAKGLTFQPNGLNKVYTENSEIWMDGYFVKGQLFNGKVFVYDRDGVLLKVRVYKDGIYDSDGVL